MLYFNDFQPLIEFWLKRIISIYAYYITKGGNTNEAVFPLLIIPNMRWWAIPRYIYWQKDFGLEMSCCWRVADGSCSESAAGLYRRIKNLKRTSPDSASYLTSLCLRGHRDWRHGHKNLCKPNANELARFAEALPSLSKQAQDEYHRLMNNKLPKSWENR